jgi:seryl-tRNA synthetase
MIAIMENYQTEDGTIAVPAVLKPYLPAGTEVLGG